MKEAQTAIEGHEAAARQARAKAQAKEPGDSAASLEALKRRVLAVSTDGALQSHIQENVEDNRQRAKPRAAA